VKHKSLLDLVHWNYVIFRPNDIDLSRDGGGGGGRGGGGGGGGGWGGGVGVVWIVGVGGLIDNSICRNVSFPV